MENIEIEDMSSYIEVLTDELLFKSEGRHSLKVHFFFSHTRT